MKKRKKYWIQCGKSVRKIQIRIGIRWIRKILASWIRIQGVKYQPKTAKKNFFTPKPQIWTLKKRDHKNFLISEWFIKFYDKNKRETLNKIWKLFFVKKIQ